MFRTRPPAYALACVLLWGLQCVLDLAMYHRLDAGAAQPPSDLRAWHLLNLACTVGLGVLLVLQLPRALRWRPRLSARPSPEVQHERERIGRNLHDQVGLQLVTAMALLDANDPAQKPALAALEQCMLDVRLLVDSMDGHDDTLVDRLARLRHRVQPVLDRRGMHLEWDVQAWPDAGMPVGGSALELTYIAREAISNALQHSGATRLRVSLRHDSPTGPDGSEGAWVLRISDNGKGLAQLPDATAPLARAGGLAPHLSDEPPASPGRFSGQGIAGMDRRARTAGARLTLEPGEGGQGLCVCVTVPDPQPR